MDVLILAGYKKNHSLDPVLLDRQIERTREMGLNPIVVLSGKYADETLRRSLLLSSCELVFDTNDEDVSLMTNLKAGIQMVAETCFVLPVEVPAPPSEAWKALKIAFQTSGFTTKFALLQLTDQQGAPWNWGFPLFVTRFGRHLLLNEENLTSFFDPRWTYLRCSSEGLAPKTHSL
jgi:hypothetical protein